ncbi:MAG TPA: GntR family transcriptional regulator [Actinospica sp.]|jgi:DNA-binding GntR family transcriptional regulator|nr:GntR family transcriptional regulator [Actinospica sp.]
MGNPTSGRQATTHVAKILREAIRAGEMAPGHRLVELDLAEQLGVTRAAVRGALLDLTGEGLVERIANRGARVRVIPVDEAVQIVECRAALEGLCAAKAAELAEDADRELLRGLGEKMREAVASGDVLAYSKLNQQLHAHILRLSGQQVAAGLLERLNAQIVRHQFRLSLRPGRPQKSLPEHLALIEAVCAGDQAAAERTAREHLASVAEALRHSTEERI